MNIIVISGIIVSIICCGFGIFSTVKGGGYGWIGFANAILVGMFSWIPYIVNMIKSKH